METVKIKHREFNIVDRLSDVFLSLERKGKRYICQIFDPKTQNGKEIDYAVTKLKFSGVNIPKIYLYDAKNGYIVSEQIDGVKVSEYIAKDNLDESIYEQLFQNAYLARRSNVTLNYEPDYWMIKDGKLFYTYMMVIAYKKEKDLVERYIRLWFNTTELHQYLDKLDIFYDKNRIKDEYSTNKEIVLMTCKYYK